SSRIANLAYWGLSKSLINSQKNIDLITTRLLVMIFAREQLKETVGIVFGSNRSPYNPFDLLDQQFNDDEILDKIEISEILSNGGNFTEANIIKKWGMLHDKYQNELSNPPACIKSAKSNQEKIFDYLNDKILIKQDLDFE
ncbi:hypothetical protein, partial [Sphingobacterium sp. IITKGP-BTPF85]|uniref:hypothetical protein n=1 Tax=Sphingobacterium sp. IITKGP-BTPF85 TaxID=1338009 RepID=UPI000569AAEB